MNETGNTPGQSWLWLLSLLYQIEPFKSSANADILVVSTMLVLSILLTLLPFIPGLRALPPQNSRPPADLAGLLWQTVNNTSAQPPELLL